MSTLEDEESSDDPHQELNDYLKHPRERVDNPVKWWGVSKLVFLYLSILIPKI
jgi:hypothetical protein